MWYSDGASTTLRSGKSRSCSSRSTSEAIRFPFGGCAVIVPPGYYDGAVATQSSANRKIFPNSAGTMRIQFGRFLLDTGRAQLFDAGAVVQLTPKAFGV